MKTNKSQFVTVENGVRLVTINGVKYYFPTYADILRTYARKDEFYTYDDYVANRLLEESFFEVLSVLKKKVALSLNYEFYENLYDQTIRDYRRDTNPDGYTEQLRQLTVTRDVLSTQYDKLHDETIKSLRNKASDLIKALNDLFENDDANGNGHDLIYTAYVVLHEYYMKGFRPSDTVVNPKNGKSVKVSTLGKRAVNNYITALKRNFSTLEDVSDDNDDDEKQSAMESVPYIERAYSQFDSIKDFAQKYALTKRETEIAEMLTDGYEIKLIAETIDRDEKTIYKNIQKIREKIK